jgi:hypothetical protein
MKRQQQLQSQSLVQISTTVTIAQNGDWNRTVGTSLPAAVAVVTSDLLMKSTILAEGVTNESASSRTTQQYVMTYIIAGILCVILIIFIPVILCKLRRSKSGFVKEPLNLECRISEGVCEAAAVNESTVRSSQLGHGHTGRRNTDSAVPLLTNEIPAAQLNNFSEPGPPGILTDTVTSCSLQHVANAVSYRAVPNCYLSTAGGGSWLKRNVCYIMPPYPAQEYKPSIVSLHSDDSLNSTHAKVLAST